MYSKITVATFVALAAAQGQDGLLAAIPSEYQPLLTAEPSSYPSIISSLRANGVSLPAGIPTDPAVISSLVADASFGPVLSAIPTNAGPDLSSIGDALASIAPTAAVSDLPAILSSAGPALASALNIPQGYISSALAEAPAQLSALYSIIPASAPLTALPAALETYTGDIGAAVTAAPSAGMSGSPSKGAAGGNSTLATSATPTGAAGSALSTGAAAGSMVGWTGALAGVAMGAVAFL